MKVTDQPRSSVSSGSVAHGMAGKLFIGRTVMGLVLCLVLSRALVMAQTQAVPAVTEAAQTPREWITPKAGDALRGANLYQAQCAQCHAVDSNKTGPAHRGVMGRRVGSLPGYKYSDELARSRLRWTPQTLNAWLEDPEGLVAGQRMGVEVANAGERADLIAFLATLR